MLDFRRNRPPLRKLEIGKVVLSEIADTVEIICFATLCAKFEAVSLVCWVQRFFSTYQYFGSLFWEIRL